MSRIKTCPPVAPAQSQRSDDIPRSGLGAASALLAMLRRRQAQAGVQPLPTGFAPSKQVPD